MDLEGPWCWSKMAQADVVSVAKRLANLESMTWQDILGKRDHGVPLDDLSTEAQRRLTALSRDDLDELLSLHVNGLKRVWGIRHGDVVRLLWWDPNHDVCPSPKKHT